MNDNELDATIRRIASHACGEYGKPSEHIHEFGDPKRGKPVDVKTKSDLEGHVRQTLFDPQTKGFIASDGRAYFQNEKTNTCVVLDGKGGGSVFRPKSADNYLDGKWERERDRRADNDVKAPIPGGIRAHYPQLGLEKLSEASTASNDVPKPASERRDSVFREIDRNDPRAVADGNQEVQRRFAREQAELDKAIDRAATPAEKERLELRKQIEKSDHERMTARIDAAAVAKSGGASPEALGARNKFDSAQKTYLGQMREWHRRSVDDTSYRGFDAALERTAKTMRERKLSERNSLEGRSRVEKWDDERSSREKKALEDKLEKRQAEVFSRANDRGLDR